MTQSTKSREVDLIVSMSTGRSISDDHWEEIDAAHIEIWTQVKKLFLIRDSKHDGTAVHISFDWSPVLTRLRRHYKIMQRIYDPAVSAAEKNAIRFPRTPIRVKCKATVVQPDSDKMDAIHHAQHHLESYLHDLFLILNLAAPGCCSFWGHSSIRPVPPRPPRFAGVDLLLSEYQFDNSYMGGYWDKWPAPKIMDLEKVTRWYRAVRNGINQVPESRAQKVLFALMHLSKGDTSLDMIIWLFYALETLYDTQPGENRRALTNRIALVLGPDEKQRSHLKKELQTLYEIRSGFAHGGREIVHPINNERLDRRVEGKFQELMDASEFGFTVLICSLQALIERGWTEFKFHETLTGQPLGTGEVVHFPVREPRSS